MEELRRDRSGRLLDLPPEIWYSVVDQADPGTIKNARLSCRYFRALVHPRFREIISLKRVTLCEPAMRHHLDLADRHSQYPDLISSVKSLDLMDIHISFDDVDVLMGEAVHMPNFVFIERPEGVANVLGLLLERLSGLEGLAMNGYLLAKGPKPIPLAPFRCLSWQAFSDRASHVFQMIMNAFVKIQAAPESVSFYWDTPQCGIPLGDMDIYLRQLGWFRGGEESLRRAASSIRSLSLSVLSEFTSGQHDMIRTSPRGLYEYFYAGNYRIRANQRAQDDSGNITALATLLRLTSNLATLRLHIWRDEDDPLKDFKDPSRVDIFNRISHTVHLPQLEECTLRGFTMTESSLINFLATHHQTLKHLELCEIQLEEGKWENVFLQLANMPSPQLETFKVCNLFNWDRSVFNLMPPHHSPPPPPPRPHKEERSLPWPSDHRKRNKEICCQSLLPCEGGGGGGGGERRILVAREFTRSDLFLYGIDFMQEQQQLQKQVNNIFIQNSRELVEWQEKRRSEYLLFGPEFLKNEEAMMML